jgi:hypothetical protein
LDQGKRRVRNYPTIKVIDRKLRITEFGRKKKLEIMVDKEIESIILLAKTVNQYTIDKIKSQVVSIYIKDAKKS